MSTAISALPRATPKSPLIGRVVARPERLASPLEASDRVYLGPLRRVFWIVFVWLLAIVARKAPGQEPESVLGATMIIVSAMLPAYLWSIGKVRGLPLFPVSALTSTWTFALPLVSDHPMVSLFPGWNQLVASMSITGFSLIGTFFWYWTARRPAQVPAICWMMKEGQGQVTLLCTLGTCALWSVVVTAGWVVLPPGVDSVVRAAMLAAEALSCFALSYFMGSGRLTGVAKLLFLAFFGLLLIGILPSLLLVYAMTMTAIGALAYLVASKRLPWRMGLLAICVFGFLHFGKGRMREQYWPDEDVRTPVAPWQYPTFFREWAQYSLEIIRKPASDEDNPADLLERASLMHWLLYFEASTPNAIPYLAGESYALIPRLFIPRLLDPDKPKGNEGNNILSIRYGIQTREDTENTSIAFGLISEAYVNFGYWGIAMLAAVLGTGYGKAARWARGMPILSFRALFAILIACMSIQAELCATSYATFLFQSIVVLLVFSAAFMRPRPVDGAEVSCLD